MEISTEERIGLTGQRIVVHVARLNGLEARSCHGERYARVLDTLSSFEYTQRRIERDRFARSIELLREKYGHPTVLVILRACGRYAISCLFEDNSELQRFNDILESFL